MKIVTVFLLIFCILFNPHISHAQIRISHEEMNHLIASNPGIKIQRILLSQTSAGSESRDKKEEEEKKKEKEDNTSPDIIDGIDSALHVGTGGGSDKAALILFAVIGLVVVIAWIPYFPLLAYDALKGDKENLKVHHLVNVQWNPIIGSFNSADNISDKESPRNGTLLGTRYSLITEKTDEADFLKLGLAIESGYYLTKEKNLLTHDLIRKEGAYWLLGPSMVMGSLDGDSLYGKLDLMAGTSFDSDLGLITRVELSGNWLFNSGFTMGVSIGGLYLRVKEDRGIISSSNHLGFIIGANAGFAF